MPPPARPRLSRVALIGALLVAITTASWLWFALRPTDHGLDVGTFSYVAATVAWVSGAPTFWRALVRAAQALLFLAVLWTGLALLLFHGNPPRDGFAYVSWWEFALPPVALAIGWCARRPEHGVGPVMLRALLVVSSLVYAVWTAIDGMLVRGFCAAIVALWLAALLALEPPPPDADTRRLVAAARVFAVVLAGVYLAAQITPALDPVRRTYEISFGAYGDEGEAQLHRLIERLESGWFQLIPAD